jgi:hypothetical protein
VNLKVHGLFVDLLIIDIRYPRSNYLCYACSPNSFYSSHLFSSFSVCMCNEIPKSGTIVIFPKTPYVSKQMKESVIKTPGIPSPSPKNLASTKSKESQH